MSILSFLRKAHPININTHIKMMRKLKSMTKEQINKQLKIKGMI